MYWSVVWCSGGCSWKCYKTLRFCSLLTRCTIPCACHAKRHLNLPKWSEDLVCIVHFDFEMCFAPQRRALFRHLNFQKWSEDLVCIVHFDFEMCFAPQRRALFRHLNFQKWSDVFCTFWIILTWKCASRHNGVHFFDISTSKSGPHLVRFLHFGLEMCFAPQRRALFLHLNFQKWSQPGVFCTFGLGNLLRATTACTFSTSQLPKVVPTWCVLYIWTWKSASRHNGVKFFSLIWPTGSAPAALASLLFDPPETQMIGKTLCFATFLPFRASASSFFWLFLFYSSLFQSFPFSLPLPCSAFHLSILSEVWLLNFLRRLKLHYTNYTTHNYSSTTIQLRTATAALHHTTSSSCGGGDHCNHCNHSKKHNSNYLSVHQWIRSVIRDSQQPTSPIGFRFLKLPPPPCAVLLVKLHLHFVMCLPIESIEIAEFHSCKVDPIWTWGAARLAVTGSTVQLFPAKVANHATRMTNLYKSESCCTINIY